MPACSRCTSAFKLLDGFITSRGMICPRCRELDQLRARLPAHPPGVGPVELARLLASKPQHEPDARRVLALDPSDLALESAVVALDFAAGRSACGSRSAVESAMRDAYAAQPSVTSLAELMKAGCSDAVAELIVATPPPTNEACLELLQQLLESGHADAVARVIPKSTLNPGRMILQLAASCVSERTSSEIVAWLERVRLVAPDEIEPFIRAIRRRALDKTLPVPVAETIEKAASARWSGRSEGLWLSHLLDDTAALQEKIESLTAVGVDEVKVLERLASSGRASLVVDAVSRHASPGNPAAVNLAASLASSVPSERARMMATLRRMRAWGCLKEIASTDEMQELRAWYREDLGPCEQEAFEKLARGWSAACQGRMREAHALIRSVIADSRESSPAACLSALVAEILVCGSELEAAALMVGSLDILSRQRKGRRPALGDEGSIARSLPGRVAAFVHAVEEFMACDVSPNLAILAAGPTSPEDAGEAMKMHENRETKLSAAVEATLGPDITEEALIRPTTRHLLHELVSLVRLQEDDPACSGPVSRAAVYGYCARRLHAPLESSGDAAPRLGSRDLAMTCCFRALAFMPRHESRDVRRWSDFAWNVGGLFRTLGHSAAGVAVLDEYWPAWLGRDDLDSRALGFREADLLPALDETKPILMENHYTSTDLDMTRAPRSRGW